MFKASGTELYIIAEAGSNHNGDRDAAARLVDIAAAAGADSVKFQLIYPEGLYIPQYVDAKSRRDNAVFEIRAKEMLEEVVWHNICEQSKSLGLDFSVSIFDPRGLDFALAMKVPYLKLASSDLNNTPLLEEVASRNYPCILSTGLSRLSEIEHAVEIFDRHGALQNLALLHCVSVYPCPVEFTNLRRIQVLREAFGVRVGFSDHTGGTSASAAAVALGATILEKHFTYDRSAPGFDHAHAQDPDELRGYVQELRAVSQALGSHSLSLTPAESTTKVRARRGLYAARDLAPGHILGAEDVLVVRPSNSLEPADLPRLIGTKVREKIPQFGALRLNDDIGFDDSQFWSQADSYWRSEMQEKKMT